MIGVTSCSSNAAAESQESEAGRGRIDDDGYAPREEPGRQMEEIISGGAAGESAQSRSGRLGEPLWPFPPEPLLEGHDLRVVRPPISYFAGRIRSGRRFSFAKINHGHWEKILALRGDPSVARMPALRRRAEIFLDHGLGDDLDRLFDHLSDRGEDFMFGVSHLSYRGQGRIDGYRIDPHVVVRLIAESLPPGYVPCDGTVWKDTSITGEILELYGAMQALPVLVIGPAHLAGLGDRLGFDRFAHVATHFDRERARRKRTLGRALKALFRFGEGPCIVLVQCGSVAPFFVERLHDRLPSAFVLDMGRSLDVWFPEVVTTQPWWRRFHPELQRNLGLDYRTERRRDMEDSLRSIAPIPASLLPAPPAAPRLWVAPMGPAEDKPCDFEFVQKVLEEWGEPGSWAESGPVTRQLEANIGEYLELPGDRAVVATEDGVEALQALVAMEHLRAGRELRWVACAFGPDTTRTGPLAEALLIDCDARGMLDLGALGRVDPDVYDGVVVVDLFGRAGDLGEFEELCSLRDKVLVLDGTAAFDSGRAGRGRPPEAVSLRHAAPWGVVEGGCVIVEQHDEATVRSIIDGGASVPGNRTHRFVTTMSDLGAAFALQRLRDLGEVAPRYDGQYLRVLRIARRLEFRPLMDPRWDAIAATPECVPLVAPTPVSREKLVGLKIVVGLPFEVNTSDTPRAHDLAERVITVPTHPGMENLSDREIAEVLRELAATD